MLKQCLELLPGLMSPPKRLTFVKHQLFSFKGVWRCVCGLYGWSSAGAVSAFISACRIILTGMAAGLQKCCWHLATIEAITWSLPLFMSLSGHIGFCVCVFVCVCTNIYRLCFSRMQVRVFVSKCVCGWPQLLMKPPVTLNVCVFGTEWN